ncbi:HdeD family acid-resistance protein [Dysgonomonas sp. Marseille-P4361]|uniref:HdeD family acid-resistance protein n=1 Tax=Dysgonomonas sp. Marseille-P4361 TaxID=2161820 RepID=UPI000D54EE83|nr:HdeD family acid-resistance protein [Dysgonomonas sp. Marseille-P4361]
MKNYFLSSVKKAVKYWWISPIIGVIAIILGVLCLANPLTTLSMLAALFVAGFLISGLFEGVFAISNREVLNGWGWTLASGIISILFGLILLGMPIETITVLLFFVGFWAMFQSIWAIGSAIELQRSGIKGWGWVLAFGILGLIFSFILITNPLFAAGFIIYLFAFILLTYGFVRIFYGFRLRSIHKELEDADK